MEYNYPTKRKPYTERKISTSNRGMLFEDMINSSNEAYLARDIAVIHKKPTPIQIVEVDYPKRSMAKITEAYYKTPSTTDYNGIYRGYYIDFDAKQCNSTSSFSLEYVHKHQLKHLQSITKHGGIGFILIYFSKLGEIYLLEEKTLTEYFLRAEKGGRKSISVDELKESSYCFKESYPIRVPYLKEVDKIIERLETTQ